MTHYHNSMFIGSIRGIHTRRLVIAAIIVLCFSATSSFAEIKKDAKGNLVEFTHAKMSDGIKIALAVGYPKGFDPDDATRKWPTIFQMSGYVAATRAAAHEYYGGYVTVNASLRGTGASEGQFAAFSDRSTKDGCEIIENWIVNQDWSNGKVGIHGHSWPGLTGFRVAATNPPHLKPRSMMIIHRSPEYPSSVLLPLLPGVPTVSKTLPASIDKLWTNSKSNIMNKDSKH